MAIEIKTNSEAETIELGAALARSLRGEEVIGLSGELGAGKTCLVKGIARGLGIKETVTSPSFVLLKTYQGRLCLHHLDFYRLDAAADFYSLGFEDLTEPNAVIIIEWAEKLINLVSLPLLLINFKILDDTTRKLSFSSQPPGDFFNYIFDGLNKYESIRD